MKVQRNWFQHREASLNWIAYGLLLAAWNVSDRAASPAALRRPEGLRGYEQVSVRAAIDRSVIKTSS